MKFRRRIYLDYASLTPIDRRVTREVKKYSNPKYANPSSLYKEGVAAKGALKDMREKVAGVINAHADEIVFTSGGTEGNALILEATGRAFFRTRQNPDAKPHLIISSVEHSSIIETANMLERHGVRVTRLPVDERGVVVLEELKKAITPETYLISVMSVNNETGAIQPIREIAKIIRKSRAELLTLREGSSAVRVYPLLHTDASQALLSPEFLAELNVEKLGVDFLTLDGSKVYGPRGVGCVFVRRAIQEGKMIEPVIYGGGQESGLRSGTENLPAIAGFAKALELIVTESKKLDTFRDMLIAGLKEICTDIKINGGAQSTQSSHVLNVSIPGIDNEFFLFQLDAKGVAVSTKSSCLRDEEDSYVLKAMNGDSKTSIRFSFGKWTTAGEIKKTLRVIRSILNT